MEVGESDAIVGQTVDVGGLDLPSKGSHIREAQVVSNNDQEVGPFAVP